MDTKPPPKSAIQQRNICQMMYHFRKEDRFRLNHSRDLMMYSVVFCHFPLIQERRLLTGRPADPWESNFSAWYLGTPNWANINRSLSWLFLLINKICFTGNITTPPRCTPSGMIPHLSELAVQEQHERRRWTRYMIWKEWTVCCKCTYVWQYACTSRLYSTLLCITRQLVKVMCLFQ